MMRNNKGVTLMAVCIVALVLVLLAGISIKLGIEVINQSKDNKKDIEISMVQHAVFEQYMLLKSEGNDGIVAEEVNGNVSFSSDSNRPDTLVGTRIGRLSSLSSYGFVQYKEDYADTSKMAYEEFYYYLNEADLAKLGVERSGADKNADRAYIVNYSTGEVFDVYNKGYYTSSESVYLEGTTSKNNETEYNFTDE